jgi:flagellar hook-associated protein 1 FlgK
MWTVNQIESGGDYQLTTKDNRLLVLNSTSNALNVADVTSAIGNGSLRAEVEIRDSYVPKYRAALDQLAYEITQQVNSIHSTGYNLNGNTNVNFFTPLTSATNAARLMSLSTEVAADGKNIAASTSTTGNGNDTAIALGNLLSAPVFTGGSVTDQYGSFIYTLGSDIAHVNASVTEHQSLVLQLQNRKQATSGVSIDEEAVQILQFQRGYEASARLIKTVDELIQVTLAMGSGS